MTATRADTLVERFYPEARFGGFTDCDGTVKFYTRVNALLQPSFTVLDAGCGIGNYDTNPLDYRRQLRVLRGKCAKVIGIDVTADSKDNPLVDEFGLIEGNRWPVEDDTVDLCLSDYVLEHVPEPDTYFAEMTRVLKTGGYACMRTVNCYSYPAWASALVPNAWHARALKTLGKSRREEDVYPTVYRCNTKRRLTRLLRDHGFDAAVCRHEGEPCYLSFSYLAYMMGVIYQKAAPGVLQTTLLAFARKM